MKKFIFVLILCLFQTINISAQIVSSSKVSVLINNKKKADVKQNIPSPVSETDTTLVKPLAGIDLPLDGGKFYALIIGISNYYDPLFTELDEPIKDAGTFYNILTARYIFEKDNIRFLKNATMADMVAALDYYAKVIRPVDNFLIFYAGHGVWDAASEIGFWLPSDARYNSKLAWFRNSTIRDYVRAIKSKHTLLISDACFGGSILKSRSVSMDVPLAIKRLYELPSRKAMTSGTMTEVPDRSPFLKYLIDRLEKNSEKYLSSEQLFSSFRIAVINNSNVIPQFGEIKDVGDEGGDFIFILR